MKNTIESFQEQILIHKKNLMDLELKKAKFGSLDVPIYILRQIEDEQQEITRLETEINKFNTKRKKKQTSEQKEKMTKSSNTSVFDDKRTGKTSRKGFTSISVAFIGLAGTIITAYFGFLANTEPTAMIIKATQTAQILITSVDILPTTVEIETTTPQITTPSPIVTYPTDCLGYERVEDWNQAAECYKQKVIANPEDFSALANVARVYSNGEQYDKVVGISKEMMAIAHNHDEVAQAILYAGAAQYNLGEFSLAIHTLSMEKGYSETSSYFPILIWLARSYDAIGDKANACESYKTILMFIQNNDLPDSTDEYLSGTQRNCP